MSNRFQIWEKLGLINLPKFSSSWMKSHYAVPFADKIKGNIYNIYFCIRDQKNRSNICSLKFNLNTKRVIQKLSKIPLLTPGKLGTFDENGVTPSWIINTKKKKLIFYVGWNSSGNTRMSLFTGLGEIKNKKIRRYQDSPILERSKIDPYLTATNCILYENGIYKMWYVSGDGWTINKKKETFPIYNIKLATSKDCFNWKRKGHICIDYKSKNEFALARPSILKIKNKYFLWYSYKSHGSQYKIGFATSNNGLNWKRQDELISFLPKKKFDWENEMQAYPHVFSHKDAIYMMYNGNGYGKSGIALAKLKSKL